jgi:acetyl esterase/lipase
MATYEVMAIRGLVYSNAGNLARLADLYLPVAVQGKLPVIIWVHGGGWRFGDRNLSPDLTRWFAERGFAMVTFDYRLSGEATFPSPVVDVRTVIRWVRSVAEEYGLDPDAIGLWGSSAGAQLSAIAALAADDLFLSEEHAAFASAVTCVVNAYCPVDFARIDEDRIAVPPKVLDAETVLVKIVVPTNHPDSFESRHIGTTVATGTTETQRASPLTYVGPGAPPFLLLHGESDALMPWTQSLFLYEALVSAGNQAKMVLFERFGHGFLNNSDLDSTDSGETKIYQPGATPKTTTKPLKCFALCEQFFRYFLLDRASSIAPFRVEGA